LCLLKLILAMSSIARADPSLSHAGTTGCGARPTSPGRALRQPARRILARRVILAPEESA